MEIQVGQILIAKDECRMDYDGTAALIIGKEYEVRSVNSEYLTVNSEFEKFHGFDLNESSKQYYTKFFDIKQ